MSQEKKKKKSERQSALEKEIFRLMENSLKAALDAAVNDLLKDFGKK